MGQNIFFFVIAAGFLYVTWPLLTPLAMGAVFAVLFFPWLERLERRKVSTRLAAAFITVAITFLVLLPTALLTFVAAKSGFEQLRDLRTASQASGVTLSEHLLQFPWVSSVVRWVSTEFPVSSQELFVAAADMARSIAVRLADALGTVLGHVPGMVMALAVIVVSTYFFLADGRRVTHFLRRNSLFNSQQTEQLMHGVVLMCRSVILASVASGVAQAVLFGVACLSSVTPNVGLITFLVFFASFIPLIGSAPVTFGVALQQYLSGRTVAGTVLLIAAVLVSVVDNLVRPLVLQGSTNLHPMLAFVAAFGGLQALGVTGIFLGPIIAGVFVVSLQILMQRSTSAR